MKRKLALLLAAVMVMAAMPMTLFAATSENRLMKSGMSVPDYTLFYESGLTTGVSGTVSGNSGRIEYWVDGSNLVIEVKDPITEGLVDGNGVFRVSLENAKWFFRITSAGVSAATALDITDKLDAAVLTQLETALPQLVTESSGTYEAASREHSEFFSGTGLPNADSTFDTANGAYSGYKYLRMNAATPNHADPDTAALPDVPYLMEISMADESNATITLLRSAKPGDRIIIPIVSRSTSTSSDVRVYIEDNSTSISRGNYLLASSGGGKTKARATGTVVSRSDFRLDSLVITEQRIGSIRQGAGFELVAPSGFSFADLSRIAVYTEGGLTWAGGVSGPGRVAEPAGWTAPANWPGTAGTWRNDYSINYRVRGSREDRSVLEFALPNIMSSTKITGNIVVTGILLVADEPDAIPATGRELSLTVRNLGTGSSYTEESFVVGKVSDYIISMTRTKDAIPELVSGRLDSFVTSYSGAYEAIDGITDENHKAAVVRIEEAIPNAWWAERTTEFALPEGVKILKAKFTNLSNLDTESTSALTVNTGSATDTVFYNTGSRVNSAVTVKDNALVVSRLRVSDNTKKAKFDLSLWLNIDVAFEGDIDLTLAGSAVTNEQDTPSVTIARAIRPIEVNTRVSDIRVGYQYVSVADFDIVETKAGNLRQGEMVYVSITDEISVDMNIAKGFNVSVTDGNIRISNAILRSALGYTGEEIDGQLRFDIDRESTEASTISFTNVQVKAANTVPQSNLSVHNERGINLVVWGPAIAQNYEGLLASYRGNTALRVDERISVREFFPTPGIRANYINITTPAPGGVNEFTNEVRVSIGNPIILIGEDQYTMPVSAYVSPKSNSTMVPVRFVSLALGLPETAVKWDSHNRTCTVDAGTRIIQFQVGNTNYLVNGVSIPMTSPDGLSVAMEISEERSFVPFRALGEAFGITVTWDEINDTAIYNASEMV